VTDAEKLAALQRALVDAEQRLARIGELELELREVTTRYDLALTQAIAERDEARAALGDVRRALARVEGSASWRVTAPLRALKRR
jgi:inorganic triphosphatase YgiF